MWLLFAGTTLLFAALYLLLRRSVSRAARQIREIATDLATNRQTLLHSPDQRLEALLVEVNGLLAARQTDRIRYERKEQELRKQMANITHDLRTPLTSMLGFLELLQEGQLTPEEQQDYLAIVEKRTKALRSLISGFYELSRMEAGDYPLNLQPLNLQTLLKRALAEHYPELTARGFEVVLELPDEQAPVIADEELVLRIYRNLLQNVQKHGERSLHVFQGRKGEKYVTILSNETSSLQEADVPHLFERSFTADRARSEHNTGLGLAIVQGLMQQMGYRVSAEYREPVFRIDLEWSK